MTDDVLECPVCLEVMQDDATMLRHPGCGHAMHTVCALNAAQYDVRCPLCRGAHADLKPRCEDEEEGQGSTTVVMRAAISRASMELLREVVAREGFELPADDDDDEEEERLRARRRWSGRKQRLLRARPDLRDLSERMRGEQRAVRAERASLDRLWARKERALWAEDEEVGEARERCRRLARRASRLKCRLERLLEAHIGPPPPVDHE